MTGAEIKVLLAELDRLRADYIRECRSHNQTLRLLVQRDESINAVRRLTNRRKRRIHASEIQLALGDE